MRSWFPSPKRRKPFGGRRKRSKAAVAVAAKKDRSWTGNGDSTIHSLSVWGRRRVRTGGHAQRRTGDHAHTEAKTTLRPGLRTPRPHQGHIKVVREVKFPGFPFP